MVQINHPIGSPLELAVTGEAEDWLPALGQIVGPKWLQIHRVHSDKELIEVARTGRIDAAVLDEDAPWYMDVMGLLRMLHQINPQLPVVVVTQHQDRRYLENALKLQAFSVVVKPLGFESLIRQVHGIMERLAHELRQGPEV